VPLRVAIHEDAMRCQLLSSAHGRRGEAELVSCCWFAQNQQCVCLIFLLTAIALYRLRETLATGICDSWAGCCLC